MPENTPARLTRRQLLRATAIAAGTYGQGHVVAISSHPERSDGLDGVIRNAVKWAAGNGVLWALSYFFWRRLQVNPAQPAGLAAA